MSTITLVTYINAPRQICFDLSRSIDLHLISSANFEEEVIDGRSSGLINYGEFVTWRAKHLGKYRTLTVEITDLNAPVYFEDKMIQGDFKNFCHRHFFVEYDGVTTMQDVLTYQTPYSIFGKIYDILVLKRYMKKYLISRNQMIKEYAENGSWKDLLPDNHLQLTS